MRYVRLVHDNLLCRHIPEPSSEKSLEGESKEERVILFYALENLDINNLNCDSSY